MKNKLILIVAGEPNSVFSEILFKSLKSKKIKKNFILICSKNLLIGQMKKLGYHFKIKIIDKENFKFEKEKINIIDINFKFKNVFDKISDKSNKYLEDSFRVGLDLLKTNNFWRLRLGIGHPGEKKLVDSHVLNDFTDEETEVVDMSVQKLLDNVHLLIDRDLDNFSSKSNI